MKSWPKLDGALADYVDANWLRESPLKRRLREETAQLPQAGMQISAHQGQQIALFARAVGARRAVEVGTFTGYSSLSIAEALPADGKLWCCDVSEQWTGIARRYWKEAGVDSRIELTIAPALKTLDGLLAQGLAGQLDLAFIDANKDGYDALRALPEARAPGRDRASTTCCGADRSPISPTRKPIPRRSARSMPSSRPTSGSISPSSPWATG
jgi:predicted O-methyltransferase YrrM